MAESLFRWPGMAPMSFPQTLKNNEKGHAKIFSGGKSEQRFYVQTKLKLMSTTVANYMKKSLELTLTSNFK